MPLSLALIAWRMLKPREVGSTDVYSFNPANTVGDRVYIFLALLKNSKRIAGPPAHAQSVPAGPRVGSCNSEPGIGPKGFSALSPVFCPR
nr:uncharacterized protein LOC116151470 isoform X5 [Camelus dromedarius]